jgi:hypothetical protein
MALAAAVGRLSQTVHVVGADDVCGMCGHQRYLVTM